MRLDRVAPGDVIKASIKGRSGIWGEVTEIKDGVVYFTPLCPATGWRHASARDGPDMLDVVSKEQLSLPGSHT
jgi:hypothetical protein